MRVLLIEDDVTTSAKLEAMREHYIETVWGRGWLLRDPIATVAAVGGDLSAAGSVGIV
jgi:hypothetical protein